MRLLLVLTLAITGSALALEKGSDSERTDFDERGAYRGGAQAAERRDEPTGADGVAGVSLALGDGGRGAADAAKSAGAGEGTSTAQGAAVEDEHVDAADAVPGVHGAAGGGGVERIICAYPWPCAEALAVAWCESRYVATAISPDGANYGIFQVNRIHAYRVAGDLYALLDPGYNVAVAWAIYRDAGYSWQPWSCKP